jgi:hypothetical protein
MSHHHWHGGCTFSGSAFNVGAAKSEHPVYLWADDGTRWRGARRSFIKKPLDASDMLDIVRYGLAALDFFL